MRVLHISETDYEGGAGMAAYALHRALRSQGVDSFFVAECCRHRDASTRSVSGLAEFPARLLRRIRGEIDALPLRRYPQRGAMAWSVGGLPRGTLRFVRRLCPDVVHLHWIDQVLSVREVGALTTPVVWTQHDWGAFTGGCRCPVECRQFQTGCGRCPLLRSHNQDDLSHRTCLQKRLSWSKLRLQSVAVGAAIADDVRRSQVLGGHPCEIIPNGVDVDRFRPMDRSLARAFLGFDPHEFVILFGAYSLSSPWKGAAELMQALSHWRQREPQKRACLVTVGFGALPTLALDLPVKSLGFQKSPETMAKVYAAADVVVMPSWIESFGLMAAEAAACGTPTVAFAGTGVADIVRHGETGFLARARDAASLADGIAWAAELPAEARVRIGVACREGCMARFSGARVAAEHVALYNRIVAGGESRP